LHELGELGSGDVWVRVSLVNERREFDSVKIVKRNEVWFVERLNSGWVCREGVFP
jgi:hypothetical protein